MKINTSSSIFPNNRLEALADGVFAIVMTLLVLELSIPVIADSAVEAELLDKLIELLPKVFVYILSFLILGIMWANHRIMFHYINRSDGKLAWMNIFILMFVALTPFSASLLGEYSNTREATAIFGINIFIITTIGMIMWLYISGKRTLSDKPISVEVITQRRIFYIVGCTSFAIGAGISFVSPAASIGIYGFAALMTIIISWRDSHGYLSKLFVRMKGKKQS